MSDGDAYDVTLKMTRGTSSDDKEVLKTTVTADDLEELDEKMDAVRDRMDEWAGDLREIQPIGRRRDAARDDQSTLGGGPA
jgi:tetrahydromethanopterin S-methyltransferase subunit G